MSIVKNIEARLAPGGGVLLCMDFDGTLAPIVDDPSKAELPRETRAVLERLRDLDGVTLAIISGRAIDDLEARARIRGVIYAGNHGMQIRGCGLRFYPEQPQGQQVQFSEMMQRLIGRLAGLEGVWVEDKGLTASVHYRRNPDAEWDVKQIVDDVVGTGGPWKQCAGRKIIDIVPAGANNKGDCVNFIRGHMPDDTLCIYAGDDVTDENAFAVLSDGITIAVGPRKNATARYRLRDPWEMMMFLEDLSELLQARLDSLAPA